MQTLGDVLTLGVLAVALIVVPYKLAKAWVWPLVHPLLMSRSAALPARTTVEPVEPTPVLADTHRLEPAEPAENEPAHEPIALRQLPRRDLIVLLAVQRGDDGDYVFSANRITEFVGGTAAPVKALIAEVRSGKVEEKPLPAGRVERPAQGWA